MKISLRNSKLTEEKMKVLEKKVHQYIGKVQQKIAKNDYAIPESALSIANDAAYQRKIAKALIPFQGVRHVVLVGIGGSNLGTEAVYKALKNESSPQLYVLDGVEGEALTKISKVIAGIKNPEHVAIVIISKSGTTTETILNARAVLQVCEHAYGAEYVKRVICIGNSDTEFLKAAKKKKITTITIPDVISGRYSVFSAVGIVPLTLLGIDIPELQSGAAAALSKEAITETEKNVATLALHAERGVHTINFFTFNTRLETCGVWYRQLLAESIGKNKTKSGSTFKHQILPVVSTSVDLHSQAQLYLGGYKNLYTHFVYFPEEKLNDSTASHWLMDHVPQLQGKSAAMVKDAITKGVLHAYDDGKLPYRYTELTKCTAYEIGYLLNSLMLEVMCLAQAFDINAFDQPHVELYKKHTRVLLDT